MSDIIAYAATGTIAGATLVAAVIAGILIARRGVPRALAFLDGLLCAAAIGLHFPAQLDENLGSGFAIAVPFVVLGGVAGVVLAWRRVRQGERPLTVLTVAHAGTLLIGLILMIEGVTNAWGPSAPGS